MRRRIDKLDVGFALIVAGLVLVLFCMIMSFKLTQEERIACEEAGGRYIDSYTCIPVEELITP